MNKISRNIFVQYLQWHFFDQPKTILKAWRNFLLFNLNFWSVVLLLKTLFSYWHGYRYNYGKGFDIGRYLEVSTFNLMSRVLGAIVRLVCIAIGLIAETFILIIGFIIFVVWLALPLLLIGGLCLSFGLLFLL